MSETELLRTEVARVMSRAHPPVIMTLEDIAGLFGYALNYVRNDLQNQPGFPPRLDRFKQPRWSRDSIFEWRRDSKEHQEPPVIPKSIPPEVAESERVKTYLYRHFDAENSLLYVGISLSAINRLSQHRRSAWADQIVNVKVEQYPSRHAALVAEFIAIQTECPKHNITYSKNYE